ncbi:hypothetical protein [Caulobacter segnis]
MKRIILAAVIAVIAVLVIWFSVKTHNEGFAIQAKENAFSSERSKHPFMLLEKSSWGADYADQGQSGRGEVSIVSVYFDEQHLQSGGVFFATRNVFKYNCKGRYYTLSSSEPMDRQGKVIATIPVNSDHRFSSASVTDNHVLAYACENRSLGQGFKSIARVMQHGRSLAPDPLGTTPN